ncbi:MAG: immunoglobulin domain-containing protein [Verrucomicrobiae bacterium]|nr:immunoglobulin domain-containing protein [Verrucomicrobiae bacterium]
MERTIRQRIGSQAAVKCLFLLSALVALTAHAQTLDSLNLGANNVVNALAIQTDGKILVGGSFTNFGGLARSYLARINTNGTVDTTFTNGANNTVNSLVVQTDGGILVGGTFTTLGGSTRNAIGRLSSGGALDSFFNPGVSASPASAYVSALAVQPDGRILVAGFFSSLGFFSRTNIGRLNSFGSLDSSFNAGPGGGFQNVNALAVQLDGKILIGGSFTNLAGQLHTNIARLNSRGSLDTNFNAAADEVVSCLALQADGKILVGGSFTNLSGQPCNYIGRFNSDGSFDGSFNPGASGSVLSLVVQADGKIVVGGTFTNLVGQARNYIGRLNGDGSLDDSFNVFASSNVVSLAIQTDGKILAGGSFTNVAGQARNRLARLNNTGAATQSVVYDATTVTWLRGGTSPDVWRTTFDLSTNGGNLSSFGSGNRISGGWQITGLTLPTNVTVRARGFLSGGRHNGSGGYVESIFGPPAITSQPSSRTVNAGSATSFSISAVGSATLNYQWRRNSTKLMNGGNVSGAQSPTLGLNNLFGIDGGHYSCLVMNSYGVVTSGGATLTVVDPRITVSPTSTNASLGGTASFSVSAYGTAPLSYQWRKNGANLVGETSPSLLFSGVQAADAGSYFDAVVTNTFGSATSPAAVLTVNLASLDDFNAGPVPYGADVFSQVIQPDGKIVIGGAFQKIGDYWFDSIARLDSHGFAETNFHPAAGCCGGMHALALQTDGKILVAGQVPTGYLARLNPDGSWQSAFNPMVAGLCAEVNCLALQPDGKIIVGGSFTSLGGQACTNLGRLSTNGTLDTTFRTATAAACSEILCVALQPDGKIIYGGQFGPGDSRLGRLNADGTADTSFTNYGPGAIYQPNALVVQPDGKILVAAWFPKPSGQTDFLGRLNPDGSLDGTFNPGIGWSATIGFGVQSMALQADGKILLGGQFYAVGGHMRQQLARINPDGTPDFSFAPVSNGDVYSLGLQADGRIIVGGHFSSLEGQTRIYIARLNNTLAANQNLSFDGNALLWQRGGASPEVWRTTFEVSTNAANWTILGAGERVPGGWRLGSISLSTNAMVRARGFTTGGQYNASSWFVESSLAMDPRTPPRIKTDDSSFGIRSNAFGFNLVALQGQTVVVEASPNLTDWVTILTNSISFTPLYVSEPIGTNFSIRFYRARLR